MGFNFGRALKKTIDVVSGREFLTRVGAIPGDEKRPGWDYESPDPYTSNVQFDETGRPVGRMPKGKYALDYQYEADRRTQQRRNALWSDAHGALRQGQGLLESYRPGGAAALASGIYAQRAGLYAQESMALQSPDLLMGYREHKQEEADYERRKAQEDAQFMSILGAGVSLLGMSALGGGGGAAAAAAPAVMGGGSYVGGGGQITPYTGGFSPLGTQRGGQTMYGPGWGRSPGILQAVSGDGGAQGGAGAQPSGPMVDGGGQGGGQGAATGGGFGGDSGGHRTGGGIGGMISGPAGGGSQPMTTFRSGEAASMAMARSADSGGVYRRWAENDNRREFTYVMMQSAAARVMRAMGA